MSKRTGTTMDDVDLKIVRDNDRQETTVNHPSFGNVSLSRVTGRFPNMVGVDFEQGGAIRMEITTSTMRRSLHRTSWYADETLVELYMTEVQFAKLITGISGTQENPCTLSYARMTGGVRIPEPPKHMLDLEEITEEVTEPLHRANDKMAAALAALDEVMSKPSIKKGDMAAIRARIASAQQEVEQNAKWRIEQAEKTINKAAERSKMEVTAFRDEQLRQIGLYATRQGEVEQLASDRPATRYQITKRND